jgi:hypothetical protein
MRMGWPFYRHVECNLKSVFKPEIEIPVNTRVVYNIEVLTISVVFDQQGTVIENWMAVLQT